MTELQKQKYIELIFENEQQEQKERYYVKLEEIKRQISRVQSEGYKAKWKQEAEAKGLEFTKEQEQEAEIKGQEYADYLINLYDSVYTQNAINAGVSREAIMDKIEIEIRFDDEGNIENDINDQSNQPKSNETETYNKMYRNKRTNLKEFVSFVLSDEFKNNDRKEQNNKNKEGKTFQIFTDKQENEFTLTSDVILHDSNKHNENSGNWIDVFNNIDNVVNVKTSDKITRWEKGINSY
jgi:hypothetical protein